MNDTEREIARVLSAALLTDQRRRWQSGERPTVEEYLAAHPTLVADCDAVLDLINQEISLREQSGETACLGDYLRRFPRWCDDLRLQFEVHLAAQPATTPTTPLMDAPPGYELLGEIGRGPLGIVYRARDLRHDRTVAVKMLLPEHFPNRAAVKRFFTEARAVERLQHRHIGLVHQIGKSTAGPYVAMELIDGRSLESVLGSRTIDIADVIGTLVPVAEAVDYAHRRGVIHRNLKPANILLDPERGPVVVDFGTGMFKGAGSPSSDIHALGVILYTMLAGRPPFADPTAMRSAPPQVRQFRPDVPQRLEYLCLRCLEKTPRKRFATALALADALRALGDDGEASTVDMPDTPFLIDETTGQRHHIIARRLLLGRAADCDLRVRNPRISRHHCQIVVDGDEAELEDLGSSWGTLVNGQRVQRAALHDGDRIEMGGLSFLFRRPA
jgi:eukaryotic-like serine/threonine-protein kinase